MDVETIPTGSLSLDLALGLGGIPKGRVVEIYGPESSGKTTVTFHMVAEVQKRAALPALLTQNMPWTRHMRRISAWILDTLHYPRPDNGEQALRLQRRWCVPVLWILLLWTLWRHWFQKLKRSTGTWVIPM